MPQTPLQANVAVNQTTLKSAPLQMDMSGNLLVGNGTVGRYNIATKTVIKAAPGRLCKVSVNAAGTVKFGVYDAATTAAAVTAVAIYESTAVFPAAGSLLAFDWPCATGIVIDPGTSGNVSVSFD